LAEFRLRGDVRAREYRLEPLEVLPLADNVWWREAVNNRELVKRGMRAKAA
jgi:hypothetical protein